MNLIQYKKMEFHLKKDSHLKIYSYRNLMSKMNNEFYLTVFAKQIFLIISALDSFY